MTLSILALYVISGIAAGFLAGLFGVGGGLIIVPVLVYCFFLQGFEADISMHLAIGTSLATIILTSLSSIKAHHSHSAIEWGIVRQMTLGIIIGGFLGALLAKNLRSDSLQIIFAIFEILVGFKLFLSSAPQANSESKKIINRLYLNSAGLVISAISAVIGIGGGTLSVPFLRWLGCNIQNAIATSAALGLPIALAGALAFIWTGAANTQLPELSLGFVYLPAFLGIGLLSIWLAPLGARCAHRLPANVLQKVFAVALIAIGGLLLFS